VRLDDGDELVRHGEPGDALYVISHGRFGVFAPDGPSTGEHRLGTCGEGEVIGEMALLTGSVRSATVRAEGEAEALRLHRQDFDRLVATEPCVFRGLATTLSQRLARNQSARARADAVTTSPPAVVVHGLSEAPARLVSVRQALGLAMAALILCAAWLVTPPTGFGIAAWHAGATFVAIVPLMVFESLPDAALALVLVAAWVLGGVASPEVALSGFASGSWVLTITIFIVGAVIASSGISFRVALWSVEHCARRLQDARDRFYASRAGFRAQPYPTRAAECCWSLQRSPSWCWALATPPEVAERPDSLWPHCWVSVNHSRRF
jgi:divalent anion:Na+ symporter, DASS family